MQKLIKTKDFNNIKNHSLTKNRGEGGHILQAKNSAPSLPLALLHFQCSNVPTFRRSDVPTFRRSSNRPLFSIASTLFHFRYPATPVFATLTKTTGVYPNNSHSGTLQILRLLDSWTLRRSDVPSCGRSDLPTFPDLFGWPSIALAPCVHFGTVFRRVAPENGMVMVAYQAQRTRHSRNQQSRSPENTWN